MIIKCPKCKEEIDNRNTVIVLKGCKGNINAHCSICGSEFTVPIPSEKTEKILQDFFKD